MKELQNSQKKNQENGNSKFLPINNYFEYKWIKYSNQNTQSGWMDKKQGPTIRCLQEIHFSFEDTHRLKVKGWKKIFHGNDNQKRVEMAMLK